MTRKVVPAVLLAVLSACGGGGGGGGSVAPANVTGVSSPQLLEGNSGTQAMRFEVSLDGPAPTVGVRVQYEVVSTAKSGGGTTGSAIGGAACSAGVDYIVPTERTLVIPSGQNAGAIVVTVCSDTAFEPQETLGLRWNVAGAASGSATGTIVNDDAGGLNGTGVAGSFGRDSLALTSGNDDGRLGFSYAQVPSAANWQCTRDNVTGLLWERKEAGAGVHAATQTYTWAQLTAFVAAVNAQALCGQSDWRLPTPAELATLVDNGVGSAPVIDATWFPNTQATRYWTGTTLRDNVGNDAWYVDFATGTVATDNKTNTFHARLVSRGGTTATAAAPASCGDNTRFVDHGDGTVSDSSTGLMWKKCAEGLTGDTCTGGAAAALSWDEAKARPAATNAGSAGLGYGDWRLPTRAELSSLAEREQCLNPALNTNVFPAAEAVGYWSATPYAFNGTLAWSVDFFDGQVAPSVTSGLASSSKRVRLVRAGQ